MAYSHLLLTSTKARVLTIDGQVAGRAAAIVPTVSVEVVGTIYEGLPATFRVTLSSAYDQAILVDYATDNDTALFGTDYTAASGTLTLEAGATTGDVAVTTTDRAGTQGTRAFTFNIANARAADGTALSITDAAATGTINDVTSAPPPISVADTQAVEGTSLVFTVTAAFAPDNDLSFNYTTSNGTGTAGIDYNAADGTATIAANATTATVTIGTLARSGYQLPRTVTLTLSNAVMAGQSGSISDATATGTITDTELPTGDNAFFEALVALPTVQQSWSLRTTQADIDALANGAQTSFTYAPASDTYANAQDATKWLLPQSAASASSPKQMRFPISPVHDSGRLLITWDTYYTEEMLTNRGVVNVYKMFQLWMSGNGWWTHTIKLPAGDQAQGYAGTVSESVRISTQPGLIHPAIFRREPLTNAGQGALVSWPDAGQFPVAFGKWTRYWWEVIVDVPHTDFPEWEAEYSGQYGPMIANPFHPSGYWNKCSLWVADNTRGPVRLVYRAPLRGGSNTVDWESRFNVFRFEMNTSQTGSRTGDMLCYFKNVVFLKNYVLPPTAESDTLIFQRPA